MEKTNAARLIEKKGIEHTLLSYECEGALSGTEVASLLGLDPDTVFKTLVTVSSSNRYYVFMIPVASSLDLKKAAKAAGEKKIEMIKDRELLPLTGYVHGGCSPIGMKKFFITTIDASAIIQDKTIFSAGKIGYQVETTLEELKKIITFKLEDIVVD